MVELVEELRKLPQSEAIDFMIEEALAGEYHDFKNKKYVCGKVECYNKLVDLNHIELAVRIATGEFDEQADAEDDEQMRKDIQEGCSDGETAQILMKILGLWPHSPIGVSKRFIVDTVTL